MNDIYSTDFSEFLPSALRHDPKMVALAKTVTEQLLTVSSNINDVLIYSRFDELPEELVDILAYDMHIDWYDHSYSLQEKRDIVKNSVKVHKKKGTKYAVETAIRTIYQESRIEEWFEYGGKPYHFRVILNSGDKSIDVDMKDIFEKINMYKRLSAHIDSINIERTKHTHIYIATGKEVFVKSKISIIPYQKQVKKEANVKVYICGLTQIKILYHACDLDILTLTV